MTGFTDRTAIGILAHITGKTAIYTLPTAYIALYTAVGNDSGTGFTEVAGGSYARVATAGADWNSPSGSTPTLTSNANPLAFPAPTAAWGNVIAFGVCDAPTGGNINAWDFLGNFPWIAVSISAASPAVFTTHAHGYASADNLVFSTEYGGAVPTFSASNLTGLLAVAAASLAADTFTVTNGGTAVNTSGSGDGMVRKVAVQNIPSGASAPVFGAGQLVLTSA